MTPQKPRQRARVPETDDPAFYEAFGRAIKVARTERGLSRKQLAEAALVSYAYISDLESGRGRPSSHALLLVAKALGMSPSTLMASAEAYARQMSEEPTGSPAAPARPASGKWFHEDAPVMARMASPASEPLPSNVAIDRHELHRVIDGLSDEDIPLALELARRLLSESRRSR